MKEQASSQSIPILLYREYQRYFWVVLIFLGAISFHYFTASLETKKSSSTPKEVPALSPDLDRKNTEKEYFQVFQSLPGDVFRIGAFLTTKKEEDIEIFVRSPLHEPIKVGEWHVTPAEQGGYQELIFVTSDRYEDVILRLKQIPQQNVEKEKWNEGMVFVRSLFVSRVDAGTMGERTRLMNTIFGVPSVRELILSPRKKVDELNNPEWVFQADSDFLQTIEFAGEVPGQDNGIYAFELFHFDHKRQERTEKVFQGKLFGAYDLKKMQVASGNFRTPFAVPIRQGEWYALSLTRLEPKDQKNPFVLTQLVTEDESVLHSENGALALGGGKHMEVQQGSKMLYRSRLEDIGKELHYSFAFQKDIADYVNLFEMSKSIIFDEKKHIITGGQKSGEFFSYLFDTVHPFQQFVLSAVQKGNDEKEIKLEYSFDNAFWREIPFTQEPEEPQRFKLSLLGDAKMHRVYVRVSYSGEEKKSGFFALEELVVDASVPK